MPDNLRSLTATRRRSRVPHIPAMHLTRRRGGFLVIHPQYQAELARQRFRRPEDILDLPGEVISGHPDRHVMLVNVTRSDGTKLTAYLKRQHFVSWKERLRNRFAGFGPVSKTVREAILLSELQAAKFSGPDWLAFGESADGRAFLLVAEVPNAVDLRAFFGNANTTSEDRRICAERLGQLLAELHTAGFHHPDATAKHVLVDPQSLTATLLDWQSARRMTHIPESLRLRSLASLHASLAESLATPVERARMLWAYRRVMRQIEPQVLSTFSADVKTISRHVKAIGHRRSIRDQRQAAPIQKLVWLAGEAACVTPDVMPVWPDPADGTPFYDSTRADRREKQTIRFDDGREGWLVRGRSFSPWSRFVAWVRGKSWRSPEIKLARILFHLERYGVPAPRLIGFGQKLTSRCRADSFVVYEPPVGSVPFDEWYSNSKNRSRILEIAGQLLRQLHESGCRLTGPFVDEPLFHISRRDKLAPVSLGAVRAVRLARRISERDRERDMRRLLNGPLAILEKRDRHDLLRGFHGSRWTEGQT